MKIKIGNKYIGDNQSTFIVAELSCNHLQNYELAVQTIKAIKNSGADAVKLQTLTPDTITFNGGTKFFQIKQGTIWDGTTLYKLYQKAYMPWDWQPKLKKMAEDLGLIFFSAPFDETAVDFLANMKVPAYKVGSPEIIDIPLLKHTASKGKPVIISTGIAKLSDIKLAIKTCKKAGNSKIVLLKCTSGYPTPLPEVNLKTIPFLRKEFKTLVGLSDHTLNLAVAIGAVSLGACLMEKHFILKRKLGGPDAKFSLEPDEFKLMVDKIRDLEKALGDSKYKVTPEMKRTRHFAPSLFAVKDIKSGEVLIEKNIKSIRPNYGLAPKYLKKVLGKKAKKDIKKGTPLSWKLIS